MPARPHWISEYLTTLQTKPQLYPEENSNLGDPLERIVEAYRG